MIIQMNNSSLYSEDKTLLPQIDWQAQEGERWAIMGLNGSGKRLMLRSYNEVSRL